MGMRNATSVSDGSRRTSEMWLRVLMPFDPYRSVRARLHRVDRADRAGGAFQVPPAPVASSSRYCKPDNFRLQLQFPEIAPADSHIL